VAKKRDMAQKKQNEYFLYFLRNAGHKIDVTFVPGSREIWQLLAKPVFTPSCHCWQQLAMKNSSASQNDISIRKVLDTIQSKDPWPQLPYPSVTVSARNIAPAAYFGFLG